MTNVLIIGAGGTGIKTLLHVKKLIIDQNSELRLPANIKLLGLDTRTEQEEIAGINTAGGAGIWQKNRPSDLAYTGALHLTRDEYVFTGGNLVDYALGNQANGQPGMPRMDMDSHAWFNHWYFNMYSNLLNVAAGAGQFRQVGRLALDHALASGVQSPLYIRLSEKIIALGNNFLVFVVGSLAGGTGAAQFIDLAHLAKVVARANDRTVQATYAMLALPEAFNSTGGVNVGPAMMARTTAGLRELQRFMQVKERDMGYLMEIGHDTGRAQIVSRSTGALFQNIYLFGERFQSITNPADPLDVDIMYGVTATMAQWCVALADPRAGDSFLASAVNRQHGVQALDVRWNAEVGALGGFHPDYVASTGSYSVVLPVASIIEDWTARFALEQILDRLVPMNDQSNKQLKENGRTTAREDWMTHRCPAAKDAGQNGRVFEPSKLQANPLEAFAVIGEIQKRTARDWRLHFIMPDIPSEGLLSEADENSHYFYNSAVRGPLSDPTKGGLVPPQSKKGHKTVSNAAQFLAEKCDEAINTELNSYRQTLVDCCDAQLKAYRHDLLEFLRRKLNGEEFADDPAKAEQNRAGKADWLLGYLSKRVDDLESALLIWKAAETDIKEPSIADPSKNRVDTLYGNGILKLRMGEEPKAFDKQVIFSFKYQEGSSVYDEMRKDEKKQKEYLRAMQKVLERERWHFWWLMEYYLIWQFRDYTKRLHESLLATVRILRGERDTVETKLREQRQALKKNRRDAQSWSKVREIVQPSIWEDQKYSDHLRPDSQTGLFAWQRVLVDLKWNVDQIIHELNTDSAWPEPTVRLFVQGFQLGNQGWKSSNEITPYVENTSNLEQNDQSAEANQNRLSERCRKEFLDAWDELNILDYLYDTYHGNFPNDSLGFAKNLAKHCDVLLRYDPALTVERFTYLLAPELPPGAAGGPNIDQWLQQVDSAIQQALGVTRIGGYAGLLKHTDRTALTLFTLVDWIPLDRLDAYTAGRLTYAGYPSDPRINGLSRPLEHIFAAEQRVSAYDEIPPNGTPVLVKPRVTALFDEEERLRRFLKALALGFVVRDTYTTPNGMGNGHLLAVIIPPAPGEVDRIGNEVTTDHVFWLNNPSDFPNDDVPYIIAAETACLRTVDCSLEPQRIDEMHMNLEKAIQRKLMQLYEQDYSPQWVNGTGDANGVSLERSYRSEHNIKDLQKLMDVVLRVQYQLYWGTLNGYLASYNNYAPRDAFTRAAMEHEIKLLSTFQKMLEQQINQLVGLNRM